MTFWSRLLGRTTPDRDEPAVEHAVEHAVLIRIPLSDSEFGTEAERSAIHGLADEIDGAIARSGSGEYDGDEFGDGECTLYLYGPDADALWASVEEVVRGDPRTAGGHVVKRYGEPGEGTRAVRIEL